MLTRIGPDKNQPQCETARHRLLCGQMGTALHLPWPSLMRVHGPHRWSWRILQCRFSPLPEGLSSADVSRCRMFYLQGSERKSVDHRYSQYRANWAKMLFMIWSSSPSKADLSFWRSISCFGDNIRLSRWNHSGR